MFKRILSSLGLTLALATAMVPVSSVSAATGEASHSVKFTGQLIELSSTDVPTTIVVRKDPTGTWTDYTVNIDSSTKFGSWSGNTTSMADWITGDTLSVTGTYNENTQVVTATSVINLSLQPSQEKGVNGWITAIDTGASTMDVQWNGSVTTLHVTSDTHMVVAATNPASLSDFVVGDRIRARVADDGSNNARIIVVLRRGDEIYMKARTRGFWVTLNEIDDNGDGTGSIGVTLTDNPNLRAGDVNNMVGTAGDTLTVTYDSTTKFVLKYSGSSDASQLVEGDALYIVGRVNDDGTVSARLIKDATITSTTSTTTPTTSGAARAAGTITAVDTTNKTITVKGTGSAALTWTVNYNAATIELNGAASTIDALAVGDFVRVEGTVDPTTKILVATNIYDRNTFEILRPEGSQVSSGS